MSFNIKVIASIGFTLALAGICVPSTMSQQTPEPVRRRPAVIQYNGDMANLLANLTNVYDRTIGLEVDPRRPRSTVGFYLKDPTLADVLNAVTKSSPLYRWNEKEEFIEVVPLGGSSPFLDTRISNFRVDYADGAEAVSQLVNLPEVQASMNTMRLRYRDPANSPAIDAGKKMSFTLQDVTLRQVLNKIANENGSRFWILHRNGAGAISISVAPINSVATGDVR